MTPFDSLLPVGFSPGSPVLAGLPGGYEWLIVLFIILLLFGRRLPGVARSLGQGISSFKKGLNEPLDEDTGDGTGKKDPYARKAPEHKDRNEGAQGDGAGSEEG